MSSSSLSELPLRSLPEDSIGESRIGSCSFLDTAFGRFYVFLFSMSSDRNI